MTPWHHRTLEPKQQLYTIDPDKIFFIYLMKYMRAYYVPDTFFILDAEDKSPQA